MSIQAYVKKVEEGIAQKIKENLDYATANPYPSDELEKLVKSVGDKSALAKIYGPTGEKAKLSTFSVNDISAAQDEILAAQDKAKVVPGLWKRLKDGQKGLDKKISSDQYLSKIKPEDELKKAYQIFYNSVKSAISKGSKITFEEIFNSSEPNFADYLEIELDIPLDIETYGAGALLKDAFKEIFDKGEEKKTSSINPVETKTQTKETAPSQINQEKTKSEKPISPEKSAINEQGKKSNEQSKVISSNENILSSPSELVNPEKKQGETKTSPININLEQNSEKKKAAASNTSNSVINKSNSTTINNAKNESNSKTVNNVIGSTENNTVNNQSLKNTSSSVNSATNKVEASSPKIQTPGGTTINSSTSSSSQINGSTISNNKTSNLTEANKSVDNIKNSLTNTKISSPVNKELKTSTPKQLPLNKETVKSPTNSPTINKESSEIASYVALLTTLVSIINSSNTKSSTRESLNESSTNSINSQNVINEKTNNSEKSQATLNNSEKINSSSTLLNSSEKLEKNTKKGALIKSTETNKNITVDRKNMEVIKPSESKVNIENKSSTLENNVSNGGTSNSTNASTVASTSSNTSNESNVTNSQSTVQKSDGSQESQPMQSTMNVDLSQLANAITRLERILISGIDVTIKEH